MSNIKVGYCRKAFNPDKTVRMNSTNPGETVIEDICATAVYFEQEEKRILLVGMDVRNVYEYFSKAVRPMISEATGVSEDAIILHTPHNHSSPDCSASKDPSVIDWRERIGYPAIVAACVEAVADAKPLLSMEGGETITEKVSFVRRYRLEDGSWHGIAGVNKSKPAAHETDADLSLRAVRITREGGKDIILVSYQSHAACALGEKKFTVNADFVGPLRDQLEEETGGLVLYLQGACGNTNTTTRLAEEKPMKKDYTGVGKALATAAAQVLKQPKPMDASVLDLRVDTLTCTVNHTTDHLCDAARAVNAESDPDKKLEIALAAGIVPRFQPGIILLRASLPETEEMELAALRIGDLVMGFFPFEMFDTNGKQMRDASSFPMTFPCGYSLNYRGYMPSATAVPHGGYEVFMCRYVPGTGESVVLKLLSMFREMR